MAFVWEGQTHEVVLAKEIVSHNPDGTTSTALFGIPDIRAAGASVLERQVLKFHNEREKAEVKVTKLDSKTNVTLAGAVFGLFSCDDIYSADGKLLVQAGKQIAASAPSDAQGLAAFDCDLPIRGEMYGMSESNNSITNSGNYFMREITAPAGYYLNDEPMPISFTYDGAANQTLEATCKNDGTSVFISKRQLTGSDELPGAVLRILDKDGKVVREWVSGIESQEIRGLALDEPYTLVEITAPNGYAIAESIRFKLVQKTDESGNLLHENDVYLCTGKDWFVFDHWERIEDGTVVMRDAPAPGQPDQPQPAQAPAPQTGDASHPVLFASILGASLLALAALVWYWKKRRR